MYLVGIFDKLWEEVSIFSGSAFRKRTFGVVAALLNRDIDTCEGVRGVGVVSRDEPDESSIIRNVPGSPQIVFGGLYFPEKP